VTAGSVVGYVQVSRGLEGHRSEISRPAYLSSHLDPAFGDALGDEARSIFGIPVRGRIGRGSVIEAGGSGGMDELAVLGLPGSSARASLRA
jgi:hypothetical protein